MHSKIHTSKHTAIGGCSKAHSQPYWMSCKTIENAMAMALETDVVWMFIVLKRISVSTQINMNGNGNRNGNGNGMNTTNPFMDTTHAQTPEPYSERGCEGNQNLFSNMNNNNINNMMLQNEMDHVLSLGDAAITDGEMADIFKRTSMIIIILCCRCSNIILNLIALITAYT